jgi:hypothetical protein
METNWLIISGTKQNTCKTTLACRIIKKFGLSHQIVGIKISPHFHSLDSDLKIIEKNTDFTIAEEINPNRTKDSSRMLRAGALRVFYIQTGDENLSKVSEFLFRILKNNEFIVCESGGIRNIVEPALFFICNSKDNFDIKEKTKQLLPLADKWITFDGIDFDFDTKLLEIKENKWTIIP